MLELGNGSCEIRYTGAAAGVYSLGVFVDEMPMVGPGATPHGGTCRGYEWGRQR